jgi:hypothetical protein
LNSLQVGRMGAALSRRFSFPVAPYTAIRIISLNWLNPNFVIICFSSPSKCAPVYYTLSFTFNLMWLIFDIRVNLSSEQYDASHEFR